MKKINYVCADCENKNCFIKKLSPEWLAWVDAKKYTIRFPKEQNVFRENAEVNGVYFIKEGKVKVFSEGINEKEKIVRLAGDGHILGHRGYGAEKYPVSAAALADSVICFIDNENLQTLFMYNAAVTYALMMFYSRALRKSEQRSKFNAQTPTRDRVVHALLYIKETFGYFPETTTLDVHFYRSEIASIANTTAEEVSRVL